MVKEKRMKNFKDLLEETLTENKVEALVPSREYSEDERIYMQGYNDALQHMLEDFNAEYSEFIKNTYTASLN
jgi:hypothetical protein